MLFRETASHPASFSRIAPFRLHTNPVFLLAACFAVGILCRAWWQPPLHAVVTCTALLAAAFVARGRAPRIAWPATAIAFVALGWAAALLQPSREDTSLLRYADGLQRTVDIQIDSARTVISTQAAIASTDSDPSPEQESSSIDREVLQAHVLRVEDVSPDASTMRQITGGVLITLRSRDPSVAIPYLPCGAHVGLTVRMHAPARYRDPGAWNYADTMQRTGVSAVSVADMATLRPLPPLRIPIRCRLLTAQHWSSQHIASLPRSTWMRRLPAPMRFTADDAAVLRAMLLGDRSDLDRSLRIDFERTGSFHLLVVAGVHITILTGALYVFLLRLRMPGWAAVLITCAVATVYALLTGFGQPVQRALLMCVVYLVTLALSRDRQMFNALGIAVLVMLVLDPQSLADASLQMTVLSVIAVGGIAVPIVLRTIGPCARSLRGIHDLTLDALHPPHLAQLRVSARMWGRLLVRPSRTHAVTVPQRIPAWLLRGCFLLLEASLLTLIAETVMALPMAVYFHRLTPFAAPANLLALPLIGCLLGCAIVAFLLALIHPLLAAVPVVATATLLHLINWIIHTFSALHGADVRVPAPITVCTFLALCLWMCAVVCLRERSAHFAYAGVLASCIALIAILIPPSPHIAHNGLSFTAMDVGQGDSLLVTTPDGHSMVIDAGGPIGPQEQTATARFDVGEDVVSPFLWHAKHRRIDVLAITHAHSDHLGGAMAVLRNFRPRELWLSVNSPSPAMQQLLAEAVQRHIAVRYLHAGDSASLGLVSFTSLSPSPDYQTTDTPSNDDSLVLRLQYGAASVLAAGDAERTSEQWMLQHTLQPVTLLKVGHHGSNTSTTQGFLQQIHPQYAVISCGRDNHFGHPRMPVLQRLADLRVLTSRTDTMGAITYLLHADGSVETHVLPPQP